MRSRHVRRATPPWEPAPTPAVREPVPADALVGGVARIEGRGRPSSSPRTSQFRWPDLSNANQRRMRFVHGPRARPPSIDGAGEIASNARTDTPTLRAISNSWLTLAAPFRSSAWCSAPRPATGPMTSAISIYRERGLGPFRRRPSTGAGGAGIDDTEGPGDARMHTSESGVAYNLAGDEKPCLPHRSAILHRQRHHPACAPAADQHRLSPDPTCRSSGDRAATSTT